MVRWTRGIAIALLGVLCWGLGIPAALATPAPETWGAVVTAVEQLDSLRSGLASTLEGTTEPPTPDTFKQVCKPVGMRAKQLSAENGWQVKQIASKYRNPAHAPDTLQSRIALAQFERNPDLVATWQRATVEGQPGYRYYRRITVEASCLACHGRGEQRPGFIQAGYPDDRAYGFQVGDLRGMYAVFVPDGVQDSIALALGEQES